jgi:hypothetical protein
MANLVLAEHPARAVVLLLLGRHPAVAHAHTLEHRTQRKARRDRGKPGPAPVFALPAPAVAHETGSPAYAGSY